MDTCVNVTDYWAAGFLWLAGPHASSQRMGEPAENRKEMKVVQRQARKTGKIMEPGKGKGAAHPRVWLKSLLC